MRVVDLDRDMSDVIPTGMTPDSEFLFERMTGSPWTHRGAAGPAGARRGQRRGPGRHRAGGAGRARDRRRALGTHDRDGPALRGRQGGTHARLGAGLVDLRCPSRPGRFDACVCKGAMDHFDAPERAIAEMARVTRTDGRVVLAIANFESLACRSGRALDDLRQDVLGWRSPVRVRRGYDAPSDHFTRYELDLIREQAEPSLVIESMEGISMGWGMPGWSKLMAQVPGARGALGGGGHGSGWGAATRRWPTSSCWSAGRGARPTPPRSPRRSPRRPAATRGGCRPARGPCRRGLRRLSGAGSRSARECRPRALGVVLLHEHAAAGEPHHLGQRAGAAGHHRRAAGHRLHGRQPEALVARGHDDQRGPAIESHQLVDLDAARSRAAGRPRPPGGPT